LLCTRQITTAMVAAAWTSMSQSPDAAGQCLCWASTDDLGLCCGVRRAPRYRNTWMTIPLTEKIPRDSAISTELAGRDLITRCARLGTIWIYPTGPLPHPINSHRASASPEGGASGLLVRFSRSSDHDRALALQPALRACHAPPRIGESAPQRLATSARPEGRPRPDPAG
jgi:hypothetical protein